MTTFIDSQIADKIRVFTLFLFPLLRFSVSSGLFPHCLCLVPSFFIQEFQSMAQEDVWRWKLILAFDYKFFHRQLNPHPKGKFFPPSWSFQLDLFLCHNNSRVHIHVQQKHSNLLKFHPRTSFYRQRNNHIHLFIHPLAYV